MEVKTFTTLAAAQAYVAQGWSVIPLKKDRKPLLAWKEFQQRRATPAELAEWFDGTDNLVGVVTGSISNLTVVDTDSEDATALFAERNRMNDLEHLGETLQVRTARGYHYYFEFTPDSRNFQSVAELPGIDLRSEGGYVVAPPSIHPKSGNPYVWANDPDTPLLKAPAWLFVPRKVLAVEVDAAGKIPVGQRHPYLMSLAGTMRRRDMTQEAIQAALMTENMKRCSPELPEPDVAKMAHSVMRYAPGGAQKEARKAEEWPELHKAALYGLAGDIVNTLSPFTEADKVTLLVHLLSELSCMVGRVPHIRLDGDYSPLLFWPVVVGDTSKSRKGAGSKRIKRINQKVDPLWTRGKHSGSLSSGEGLIYAVRDEEFGVNKRGEEILKDEGIVDKRLYLVQSEFGAMLRIMAREGNSLSGHLRDAWDGETLKPMTKGDRIQATHPHIVVVGHVTQSELQRNLDSVEMANGFGNRFCWFVVKRSKYLPFAEDPPEEFTRGLVERLQAAVKHSRDVGEIGMTENAREWWCKGYEELSQGTSGLAGSLLDRGEAQVRRIAALYALLDSKRDVEPKHLCAALALWEFSVASVKHIFGEKVGDRLADTILPALGIRPHTDSEISGLFSGNVSAERLAHAKETLRSQGKIVCHTEPTGRRPKNIWELVRN